MEQLEAQLKTRLETHQATRSRRRTWPYDSNHRGQCSAYEASLDSSERVEVGFRDEAVSFSTEFRLGENKGAKVELEKYFLLLLAEYQVNLERNLHGRLGTSRTLAFMTAKKFVFSPFHVNAPQVRQWNLAINSCDNIIGGQDETAFIVVTSLRPFLSNQSMSPVYGKPSSLLVADGKTRVVDL